MTDIQHPAPPTPDEVIAFLEAKGANTAACPACGHSGWAYTDYALWSDGQKVGYCLGRADVRGEMYAIGMMPALVLTCDSCGLLRLHSTESVMKWLNDRSKPDGQ